MQCIKQTSFSFNKKKNLYKKDTKLTYLINRTLEEIKTWLIKKVNNPSKQCLFQKLEQYCNMWQCTFQPQIQLNILLITE